VCLPNTLITVNGRCNLQEDDVEYESWAQLPLNNDLTEPHLSFTTWNSCNNATLPRARCSHLSVTFSCSLKCFLQYEVLLKTKLHNNWKSRSSCRLFVSIQVWRLFSHRGFLQYTLKRKEGPTTSRKKPTPHMPIWPTSRGLI
jgi:hypothetical protein